MIRKPHFELVVRDVRAGEDAVWMSLVGELGPDEVRLLTEAIAELAHGEGGAGGVVLDLADVSYCGGDSAFALSGLCAGMKAVGIDVTIAQTSPIARLAFAGTGVDRQLPWHER
ncbi:STAS domain-containing protein [Streptomyces minutiscleroticus]|nr:STAS domain-containing protein [Streptomyces minutiscleroticus]